MRERRKRGLVCALAAVISLSACARPPLPPLKYSRAGTTYGQYLKDRYACMQEARTNVASGFAYNGTGSMNAGQVISRDIVLACMGAREYVRDPNGFGAPPGEDIKLR